MGLPTMGLPPGGMGSAPGGQLPQQRAPSGPGAPGMGVVGLGQGMRLPGPPNPYPSTSGIPSDLMALLSAKGPADARAGRPRTKTHTATTN